MRIFIVVAKTRPDLFQYFTTAFAGVASVEVLLDRRLGGDDQISSHVGLAGERRLARDIYDELEQRGFVIVRLPI
jgi:hypothetical protein